MVADMIPRTERSLRAVRGAIRRRLLVNALVDPDEAARRLPNGVRAHDAGEGTVVGCCLLELEDVRPAGAPGVVGRRLRAVAHRISAEWEDPSGVTEVGVFVPIRHADSRLAAALGGRWFPGVHERAQVDISTTDDGLRWVCEPVEPGGLRVRVEVSHAGGRSGESAMCDDVGATCLGADVGVSPDRRGRLEMARMEPSHRDARAVTVEQFESDFVASFSSALLSTSYLMSDAEVIWTPAGRFVPLAFSRPRKVA